MRQTIERPAAAFARPEFLRGAELRLLLFGGKGGVGKTTCAAATALHLARQSPDQQYLLVSTDPAHSLQDVLATTRLPANLDVREIDTADSLARFKQAHGRHLQQIALRGTLLDDEDVAGVLEQSMPGLDEIMAFHEIAELVQQGTYACVVVDTAPTGHTLRLLALPGTLRDWLQALDAMLGKHRCMVQLHRGSYQKDDVDLFLEDLAATIERLAALLGDPRQCGFVPVTLAEPVVSAETVRLARQLAEMGVSAPEMLVNCMHRGRQDCPRCRAECRRQREELARLCARLPGYTLWRIPRQGAEACGLEKLAGFWTDVQPIEYAEAHFMPGGTAEPATPAHAATALSNNDCRVVNPALLPPSEARLLLFAGKGGVGKTTLACATALRLIDAYEDRRVLLVSTDPAHSLSDVLDTPIGPRGTELAPRLTALEIDAEEEQAGSAPRVNLDPNDVRNGLGRLVLTLVELIRELMERQALRRMEAGSLTAEETERLGLTFMRLSEEMERLKRHFGLDDDDLNIDLGPLGKLL